MLRALRQRLFGPPPAILDDDLWRSTLHASPLFATLSPAEAVRLRGLCEGLLRTKSFTGVAGLELGLSMQARICAQACLPILHLGLHWYAGWSGIVVYPARFLVHRRLPGEDGTIHESVDELSGEAWDGGPVVLSWADVDGQDPDRPGEATASDGNVVVHEFAHKLDLLDGIADGIPPFDRRLHPALSRDEWADVLEDSLERFRAGVDIAEESIPPDVDPESPAADPWYAALALDPYAATDEAEFFAVSSEAYFVDARALEDAFPDWYRLLDAFYRPGR
jgi:Mlc titration factor MtfA (ptsG expression regulator)